MLIVTSDATKLIKLGKNLKSARESKKLSQYALAEIVGMSREHIGKVELGKESPSISYIFKMSETLDVKEKTLFDFE